MATTKKAIKMDERILNYDLFQTDELMKFGWFKYADHRQLNHNYYVQNSISKRIFSHLNLIFFSNFLISSFGFHCFFFYHLNSFSLK